MTLASAHRSLFFTAACLCCMLAAGASPIAAQTPFLVKDINEEAASYPTELVTIGDTAYFVANDGVKGLEVWKSDGTDNGTVLVADICPASCSSYPTGLTAVGQTLFFIADDGVHGAELWKSDAAGTGLVKDIVSGAQVPELAELRAFNGALVFRANDGINGNELWMSDGTEEGTSLLADIDTGSGSSYPGDLTVVGNTLFFAATGTLGRELWKSDGTASGTVLAKDINTGIGSSSPAELTPIGNRLFLTAWGAKGRELWKSDGTSTSLVKDIYYGSSGSYPLELTDAGGGVLYFMANDGDVGTELWRSDGTPGGTVLVRDILPGATSSNGSQLVISDGTLFLAADDGLTGEELWKSDGTHDGTELVLDINADPSGSSPSELAVVGDTVYFSADDGIAGAELWASNGSVAGTNLVGDLLAGPSSSSPASPASGPAVLFFAADDATAGRELWAMQVGGPVLGLSNQFAEESAVIGTSGHLFTLAVNNSGVTASEDVRVTALVDDRLTVTEVLPFNECFASADQSIDCTFTSLAPGETEVITVSYRVDETVAPAAHVANLAEAEAQNADLVQAMDYVDLVAPCQGMLVDNYLSNQTITEMGFLAEACSMISVTNVVVATGGEATLRAGTTIIFNDDFVVEAGGSLVAILDPLQSTE